MARKKTPKKIKLIQSLKSANRQLKQEIAERRRVEEALQATSELLQTLINAIPDLVCFKDSQGRWIEANQAVLDLLKLNNIDYHGKTDLQIFEILKQVNNL